MRIRISREPDPEEFAEFDVRPFRVGEVLDVTPRLAMLLVVAGCAEPISQFWDRAEAADAPARSKKPPEKSGA